MRTINLILISVIVLIVLLFASNVSADIFAIGGTGGDEIIFGYGNQIELFFAGTDTIFPLISIISPADGYEIYDFISGSVPTEINFSINETNINSCWYNIGSTNISTTCSSGYNNFVLYLSSVGNFTLSVYVNDSVGNENSSSINIIVSAYTGPRQGGELTIYQDKKAVDEYNSTTMCFNVNQFIVRHSNYTEEDIKTLKNKLSIEFGFAVTDDIINEYLSRFEELCPDYIKDGGVPDEPIKPEEKVNYKNLFIFIIIIFIIILILIIAYDHERIVLILNRIKKRKEKSKT